MALGRCVYTDQFQTHGPTVLGWLGQVLISFESPVIVLVGDFMDSICVKNSLRIV